ncbi:MAG: zinc ribbon domain-containing protein [Methanomicrobiales archaeon]
MRCNECCTDNPDKNRFCNSCGKPLPQLQYQMSSTAPAPAAPKGSGLGGILRIGCLLFFVTIIAMRIFVIPPMLDEDSSSEYTGSSYGSSDITGDIAADDNAGTRDSDLMGSGLITRSAVTAVTTTRVSPNMKKNSTEAGDPILGTWDIGTTVMQIEFGAERSDTFISYDDRSTGTWEKIATGKYELRSASGTESPIMIYDPLAGLIRAEDYSTVFIRRS